MNRAASWPLNRPADDSTEEEPKRSCDTLVTNGMTKAMINPDNPLPRYVGRVLGVDEGPAADSWLIDGLVADDGMTAIALPSKAMRTAAGVEIVRGLLTPTAGPVLGRNVVRGVESVLVLATSDYIATTYRGMTRGDSRLKVASIRAWIDGDDGYWTALRELAADSACLVIDTVQAIADGGLTWRHARELASFDQPVVGIYHANATVAGIGGDIGWSCAKHRFWYGGKQPMLESLDTDMQPYPLSLPPIGELRRPAPAPAPGKARSVRTIYGGPRSSDRLNPTPVQGDDTPPF